jgi:hypothetical protein
MWLGAAVGTAVSAGMLVGIGLPGVPWLFAVGLVKLTLLAAVGLIGVGAVVRRIALRSEARARALPGSENT